MYAHIKEALVDAVANDLISTLKIPAEIVRGCYLGLTGSGGHLSVESVDRRSNEVAARFYGGLFDSRNGTLVKFSINSSDPTQWACGDRTYILNADWGFYSLSVIQSGKRCDQ